MDLEPVNLTALLARAEFTVAAHHLSQCPPDEGVEVAFAGRSNAGKSSAINIITRHRLARASKTPGRTQQLVFFRIDDQRRLVDLPGYGYAKVPEDLRRHWREVVEGYLSRRCSLRGLVLIMDIRHPLKPQDQQLLAWSQARGLPVHVLLTKADKLSRGAAAATLQAVRKSLAGFSGVSLQVFSAHTREGRDDLLAQLYDWLEAGPCKPAQASPVSALSGPASAP